MGNGCHLVMLRNFFKLCIAGFQRFKNADFISDTYVLGMIMSGILMNAALWYYLKDAFGATDTFVTIHYTAASGVDLIGTTSDIYQLAYEAALFSLANIFIARLVYGYDVFMAYIAVSALPLLNGFMFVHGFLLVAANA